jgi:MFS transporter, DHA1 family, multidrug/chloramphenicol efflux transport protein
MEYMHYCNVLCSERCVRILPKDALNYYLRKKQQKKQSISDINKHFMYNKRFRPTHKLRGLKSLVASRAGDVRMSHPLINISRKQALCFAGFLVLYQFLTYIANDMIMPGMIHVVNSFHGQESAIATSLTAYVLGGASLQLILGPLSDYYGRRPIMLGGAAFFVVCTLLIACSNSMEQFLLARFFEGMGLCFIGVIGYATLQEIFEEMEAIRLIAILANISTLAPLLGPLAGASFILYFSWRGIFIVIGALALFALWGLWRFMPEPIGAVKKDGKVIPRVSLAPKVIFRNYKLLLKNPCFMLGAIMLGILSVPCIAWIAISPIIIVTDAKLSVIDYALWQLPLFGGDILGNYYLRKLTRQHTIKQMIVIGSVVASVGLLLTYALPVLNSTDFKWLIPGLTIYGFGLGVASGPLSRYVLFATPVSKGTAYAMISMISMGVQALGVELANYVYTNHNNSSFAAYCASLCVVYLAVLIAVFRLAPALSSDESLAISV